MNRLLRLEARRSALLPLLPVLVLLLWLSPIAQHLTPTALWPDRSADLQSTIQMLGPFVAGAAAWMAAREQRRALTDLLACTPRSPWARGLATWTTTSGWAVLFYATIGAVVFALTAAQATWGHPVLWPMLSGLAALLACSAAGFAAGRLLPSRFTTPLVAIAVFATMAAGMQAALNGDALGRLSPIYPSIGLASSVFYAIRPDLTWVQLTCYLGVTAAAFGLIALRGHAGDRTIRRGGANLTAAGLVLVAAAVALVLTSSTDDQGVVIPLLHDAASDRTVAYTPVCSQAPLPVCLHPAYAHELTPLDTLVNQIAAPLVGIPGLPVRAEQLPGDKQVVRLQGNPPVLTIPHFIIHGTTISPPAFAAGLQTMVALALVTPAGTPAFQTDPAQRAVALYLLHQAADTPDSDLIPDDAAVAAAAQRLGALTPTARHTWLTAHVTALRAGTLSLTELP